MTDENKRDDSTDQRTIRVFISSTFRDMQAERDELVLRVFPQLRKLCEDRGVTWGEVDLRWGIPEEEAAEGKVLPICLEEIRRCRPYFIGLLGERYGWIPDTIPAEVVEREPWIHEHVAGRKSVTELEILHGVLNNPDMAGHAFFYFRDPAFIEKVPQEKRQDFNAEDAETAEKLTELKKRIKHGDFPVRENYPDAKALGQLVLTDLTALINSLYPAGEQPSPLDRERMDHEAFARSRAGVYIGRQEYFDRLDAHVAGDGPPLVVLGESGGGKSALLSNWFLDRFRTSTAEAQPATFALLHFIGGSADSANATGILRRIMLELKQRFELPDEVPAQPEKIREVFPDWLTQAAGQVAWLSRAENTTSDNPTQESQATGRIVLVLDALNQLEDVDNAPDLGWLPRVFPKNCRVIVSTLPGRSLDAVQQRGWLEAAPPLEVLPLDDAERRRLIHDFLKQYTRDLGAKRTDRLVNAPQTANPLYLRVLLDELRVFGVHEKLEERIDWYLEAGDPKELYRKVIARWEEAYADGTDLVRDVLSLLWAARRGLSEAELLEALGENGRPLPHAAWSPLYLAMSDALVSPSGLLTFAHDFLRTAVREAYLGDESGQQDAHRRLAEYFQQQQTWTDRKLDELPWQLAAAFQWQDLHDTLTQQPCFLGIQEKDEYELLGYWLQLKPEFDLAASYSAAFARWEQDQTDDQRLAYVAIQLGCFLCEKAACHTAAEPLMRRALAIVEQSYGAEHPKIAACVNNLAQLLQDSNRLVEAEPLLRRALAIFEQSHGAEHPKVAFALNNLSTLLQDTNRLAEAEPLMRRALAIFEQSRVAEQPDVAICLNNLAGLLQDTSRLSEAEPLYRRALGIDEQSYGAEHPHVARDLGNLAQLLKATNRLAEAEPLMRRALAIDEQSYGGEHPNVAIRLSNLAAFLLSMNRLAEAEPLMRRALAIFEQSCGAEHPNVASQLNNLAQLLQATNRLSEAEPLMRRALAIDEQSYGAEHTNVACDLSNLAALLQATNRPAEAEPLYRRGLVIEEQSRGVDHPFVAVQLNNLAMLFKATNRLAEAEPLMRRALAIFEQSCGAEHPDVASQLNNLAMLFKAANRLAEAEPLMRRGVEILRGCGKATGHEHPHLRAASKNYERLLEQLQSSAVHPWLERNLLVRRQKQAIDVEDYESAAAYKNEIAALDQAHDFSAEFHPMSLKLLDRVAALRCLAIPTKRAIGGRLLSAADVKQTISEVHANVTNIENHFEGFEDFQFRDLCDRLEHITDSATIFSLLGMENEAQQRGNGVGPNDWLAYALSGNVSASGKVYCMANRWVQKQPAKDEAFQAAEVFDELGYPYNATALRDEFRSDSTFE